MAGSIEREKQAAAEAGAALVSEGMRVGLGTGSTVERLLPVLAGRVVNGVVYVATSPETEQAARELGLDVRPFASFDRLDLALDGADQVAPSGWLVKGGGGAHTREKVVATAAERFVVIASSNKLVAALAPPIPLELLPFGLESTLRLARAGGAPVDVSNARRRLARRLSRPGGRSRSAHSAALADAGRRRARALSAATDKRDPGRDRIERSQTSACCVTLS